MPLPPICLFFANALRVERTLNCIVECCERFKLENGRPLRLVLIHGAGSFGTLSTLLPHYLL